MKIIIILLSILSLSSCVEISQVGCYENSSLHTNILVYSHMDTLYNISYNTKKNIYDRKENFKLYGNPKTNFYIEMKRSLVECSKSLSIENDYIEKYKELGHYQDIIKATNKERI